MPKIAIDISPTIDGNAVRGIGYYTKNLVSAIQSEVKTNPHYHNWQINLITSPQSLTSNYQLIHYPYFDPFKLTLPHRQSVPTIVTVPDLIPIQFAKHFPVGVKGQIKWLIQKNQLKKTTYIITISHYVKHVIRNIIGYPKDRIFVTWLDASLMSQPVKNNFKTMVQKYNLPPKFILYVGDVNWNKNIPNLVRACLSLGYHLVIAGASATKSVPDHPWTQDIIWLQQQKSPFLHLLGFVPDEDKPYLFKLATIYCQPSFSEGFGIPPVEAMKSGCPVAYSQESSLPEVMDFCGEFFDPYSVDSIKSSLQKLWTNQKLRQKYIRLGLARGKVFDWKYTALQTLAIYQLALLNER